MSVGTLRRSIHLLGLLSVLAMIVTGAESVRHRAYLAEPFAFPSFRPQWAGSVQRGGGSSIEFCTVPLGRWVDPNARRAKGGSDEPIPLPPERIEDLGQVVGVVVADPSDRDALRSSVTFVHKNGTSRTLTIGEALVTRAHPYFGPSVQVPVKYCLSVCRVDPDDSRIAHAVFDMHCDGEDLQTLRWESPEPIRIARSPKRAPARGVVISVREYEEHRHDAPAAEKPVERETSDWKAELEAIRTTTYRSPKTGQAAGVTITRVPQGSRAYRAGARADDVILSVNGRTVTSKAEAIRVGRDEVENRGRTVLEIRLLRNGREITKRVEVPSDQ